MPEGGPEDSESSESVTGPGFDQEVLMLHLRQSFGGTPGERRAVARAASDLAAAGTYGEDKDAELSPQTIVEELADAPDGGPADRWNWWMGALDIAYGGYGEFQVRRWRESGESG